MSKWGGCHRVPPPRSRIRSPRFLGRFRPPFIILLRSCTSATACARRFAGIRFSPTAPAPAHRARRKSSAAQKVRDCFPIFGVSRRIKGRTEESLRETILIEPTIDNSQRYTSDVTTSTVPVSTFAPSSYRNGPHLELAVARVWHHPDGSGQVI